MLVIQWFSSSNVNEVIKTILNVFYEKIVHTQKAEKAWKAWNAYNRTKTKKATFLCA